MNATLRPIVVLTAGLLAACGGSSDSSSLTDATSVAAVDASVALDGSGTALIVFSTERGDVGNELFTIQSDDKTIFGAQPDEVEGSPRAFDPRLLTTAGFGARLAWLEAPEASVLNQGRLMSTRRRTFGKFDAPVEIDPGPVDRGEFELVGNLAGAALLVWETGGSILAKSAAPAADFGTPNVLFAGFDPTRASAPAAAINSFGVRAAAYSVGRGDGTHEVFANVDEGSGFLPAERIDAASDASTPRVVVAEDGVVVVTWQQELADGTFELAARRFEPGTGWQAEEAIAALPGLSAFTRLFVDAAGTVTVAFDDAEDRHIRVSQRPAGGIWTTPQPSGLFPEDARVPFDVDGEPGGAVTIASIQTPFDNDDAHGVRLTPSHGLSVQHLLTETKTAENPEAIDVAADATGTAVAVWVVDREVHAHVWKPFDLEIRVTPDPPVEFTTASVEGQIAGGSISASTELSDWDLDGDGSVDETLTTFDHPFGAAGDVVFTFHVVDSWGYDATITRTITIGSGDGGGGPPWLLTVALEGSGTVTSEDGGIDCPNDSEEFYVDDRIVDLTPTPAEGFVFDRWDGDFGGLFDQEDVDRGGEGCEFHMRSDRTITAVFLRAR